MKITIKKTTKKDADVFYSFSKNQFGRYIIGSIDEGVCSILFCNNESDGKRRLKKRWPGSRLVKSAKPEHGKVKKYLSGKKVKEIPLYSRGTDFQNKVWRQLTKIPTGKTKTYGQIATSIGRKKAYRAVGTAIGKNPFAVIVPCHRVIRADGDISAYAWGTSRKKAILLAEKAI